VKSKSSQEDELGLVSVTLVLQYACNQRRMDQNSGVLVVLHRSRNSEYNKDLKQYTTTPNPCWQHR